MKPGGAAAEVEIRPLATTEDYAACVALQRRTWGEDFSDVVPPSILKIAQRVGGVASGAFRGSTLVGFVFGITGVESGRIVHWSDMLAVEASMRGSGIGLALKHHQRDLARGVGATEVLWTFDPLVARNAHINFNKLGVTVVEYVENMYGTTRSALHGGLPTDRLVVSWSTDDTIATNARERAARVASDSGARIAIPVDFETLLTSDPAAAARARMQTRGAFQDATAAGLTVHGVTVEGASAFYLMGPR